MRYFVHKDLGHVSSLDDAEDPAKSLHDPENWVPVHLHADGPPQGLHYAGAGKWEPDEVPRRRPPHMFTAAFIIFVTAIAVAAISFAGALAVLGVRMFIEALA